MWRTISVHEKKETEFLDAILVRLEHDPALRDRADALLRAVSSQEPLIADALLTPQSPHYHAEGPFLEHHLRLMLMALYAVIDGKLHLVDVEEFRRMKGYEGEMEEMEEMMKEQAATLEVFILCHDAGKWPTVSFEAHEKSRGLALGFNQKRDDAWDPFQASERAKMRERYAELYANFSEQHPNESDRDVQAQFFLAYGIDIHYPGHNRIIHTSVYEKLLQRVGAAHGLDPKNVAMLGDLIAHHLEPLHDFQEVRPGAIGKYIAIANERGYDADDFMDVMQACVFLDAVCGSLRRSAHGTWHDPTPLMNFLRSEHDFQPSRRAEKEAMREQERKRRQNAVFRQVGLDGIALMDVLGMEPGPVFGKALRRVQSAVLGKGKMPHFSPRADRELSSRALAFYQEYFEKGD